MLPEIHAGGTILRVLSGKMFDVRGWSVSYVTAVNAHSSVAVLAANHSIAIPDCIRNIDDFPIPDFVPATDE
jgi:hypothetical protein